MGVTNRLKSFFIPVAVILVLVLGLSFYYQNHFAHHSNGHISPVKLKLGETVPDFFVQKFSDKKQTQVSDLKFKVLIINFWATWCQSCVVEMPSLQKLWMKYQSKGLDLMAISVDDNPLDDIQPMLEDLKLNLPVYTGDNAMLSELFDITAIPLTVVIDKNYKIIWVQKGEDDWDSAEMHEMMNQWLK